MKLWVFSDLHLEFGLPFLQQAPVDADGLSLSWRLADTRHCPEHRMATHNIDPSLPLVFVAGNPRVLPRFPFRKVSRMLAKSPAAIPTFTFSKMNAVDISGVRFIGGTLWTDFRILGSDPQFCNDSRSVPG